MKKDSVYIILLIVIILISIIFKIGKKDSNDEFKIQHNIFTAYRYAEGFIKQRLKSPSTARFPSRIEKSKHVKKIKNKEYYIESWVDSQNSFGAIIRTNWSCKIVFTKEKVRVENITLNKR